MDESCEWQKIWGRSLIVMVHTYIAPSVGIWSMPVWDALVDFLYFLAGSPQFRCQPLPTARDLIPFVHASLPHPITRHLGNGGSNLRNCVSVVPTFKGQGYPQ